MVRTVHHVNGTVHIIWHVVVYKIYWKYSRVGHGVPFVCVCARVCEEFYVWRVKWILQRCVRHGGVHLDGAYTVWLGREVAGVVASMWVEEIEREREWERKYGIKITVSLEGPFITGRKLALTTQFLDKTRTKVPGGGRNRAIGYVYTRMVCARVNGGEVEENLRWFAGWRGRKRRADRGEGITSGVPGITVERSVSGWREGYVWKAEKFNPLGRGKYVGTCVAEFQFDKRLPGIRRRRCISRQLYSAGHGNIYNNIYINIHSFFETTCFPIFFFFAPFGWTFTKIIKTVGAP